MWFVLACAAIIAIALDLVAFQLVERRRRRDTRILIALIDLRRRQSMTGRVTGREIVERFHSVTDELVASKETSQ
jgi:hypothetical protein